jgi:hypothetical protein
MGDPVHAAAGLMPGGATGSRLARDPGHLLESRRELGLDPGIVDCLTRVPAAGVRGPASFEVIEGVFSLSLSVEMLLSVMFRGRYISTATTAGSATAPRDPDASDPYDERSDSLGGG